MKLLNETGLYVLLLFLTGEVIACVIYYFVTKKFSKKLQLEALARGWLERIFILISLLYKLPQALILFGALKIGTRLREGETRVSNDYFLVGNLLSVFIAIIYYIISIEIIKVN